MTDVLWAMLISPWTGVLINAAGIALQFGIALQVRRYTVKEFAALGTARREHAALTALLEREVIERLRATGARP